VTMESTGSRPASTEPLSNHLPLPEGIDSARIDAVDTILALGNVAVSKATRAGFTTSVIIAAHRRGLKILIISPTKKILSRTVRLTVEKVGGVYCNIPGNQSCRYVQEKIQQDQFLEEIPVPTEKCCECDGYETCPVTEIERIDNFTVATMTYAKLEAMMLSETAVPNKISHKFEDIDLVIFDEAHVISFPSLPQVDFDEQVTIPEKFGELCYVYKKFCRLRDANQANANQIKLKTKSNPDQYAGLQVEICPSTGEDLHFQLEELLEIAEERNDIWSKDATNEVRALKDIICVMGGSKAAMSFLKSGDVEKMIITSGQGNIEHAIYFLLSGFVPIAKVCFVSGTLIECRPKFFAELADREITNVIFPDLRNTNAKMHIYPSKWKFSAWDANNGIDRAIREIREINEEVDHQPISIFAMNGRYQAQLKKELRDCANIKVHYYRSEDTMGVEQPERISIAIGLAHTPRHACDPLAGGIDDQERYLDSQQLRLNEVHAATWQAWSRIKDPNGEMESHLYCVGIRAEEISDVVTWGTNRTIKASSDAEGKRVWGVEVDEELARPIVHAEERTSRGRNRHGIREYIDRVQSVQSLIDYRMNSEKSILFPYNNNRGNVDNLGNSNRLSLYNDPTSYNQLESTSFAMTMLFAGRLDCHACQSKKPGKGGEYGFRKKETTTDIPSLLKMHLNGSETIGFYPFDTQDTCYYCAIDLDDHDGDQPQRGNAMKISHFMLNNFLPVLVEKLASSDSYHIWIPIIPAKTHTVYKFVKQVLHDAGVNGADPYPRQKSLGTCHRSCGDFLTLPLGINLEKNRGSEFVDPMNFEPIAIMLVERVIHLRDMPPEEKADQEVAED